MAFFKISFGAVEPLFGLWVFFVNMLNILMRKKADTRAPNVFWSLGGL